MIETAECQQWRKLTPIVQQALALANNHGVRVELTDDEHVSETDFSWCGQTGWLIAPASGQIAVNVSTVWGETAIELVADNADHVANTRLPLTASADEIATALRSLAASLEKNDD